MACQRWQEWGKRTAGNARVFSQHMQSLHVTIHSMNQLRRVSRHRTPTKSPCERCKNTRIAREVHRQMSPTRMHRATLQFRCLYFWLTCLVVFWACLADWLTVEDAHHLPRPSGPPASVRIFHTAPRPTTYRVRRSAPANARFCGAFGISITPSALPLRSNTSIPAELATYSRPCASTARPSAPLDGPLSVCLKPASFAKSRRFETEPSLPTLYASTCSP